MRRLILMMVVALGVTSCFKETAYQTNLIVKPYMESESGGDIEPLSGVVAHAFRGSLDDWEISSFEDAIMGLASSIESTQQMGYMVTATPYNQSESELEMIVEQESIFVVVADPVSQIYAYSDYSIPINLAELYITVTFREWKSDSYTSSTWTFIVPESEEEEEVIEDEESDDEEEVEDGDENDGDSDDSDDEGAEDDELILE